MSDKAEQMAEELIKFLKKNELWETDTGIYANGKYFSHKGTKLSDEKIKGAAFMWFEGPLNHAINHGLHDPQYKIYNGLKTIMEKHGFYPAFGSNCDFNIYPLSEKV